MKNGDQIRIKGTRVAGTIKDPSPGISGYVTVDLPSLGKCRMFHVSAIEILGSQKEGRKQ